MHILIFYYYYDDNDVIMYVQGPISKIFMEILFYFRFFLMGLTRQDKNWNDLLTQKKYTCICIQKKVLGYRDPHTSSIKLSNLDVFQEKK